MAPLKFPDEVNVFLVPHSRMKDLVGTYMDQVFISNLSLILMACYFDFFHFIAAINCRFSQ